MAHKQSDRMNEAIPVHSNHIRDVFDINASALNFPMPTPEITPRGIRSSLTAFYCIVWYLFGIQFIDATRTLTQMPRGSLAFADDAGGSAKGREGG